MNVEEREIKQFSEFDEITPESTQNLITDKGRFTVGTLYNAVLEYIRNLVSEITTQATEESTAVAESHANTSMLYAEKSHTYLEETKASAKLAQTLVINATELGQRKSNRGEFWFECGALTTTNKMPLNTPFSCVWTMAMTQDEFVQHKTFFPKIIGNLGYWSDAGYGWCINRVDNATLIGVGAKNVGGTGQYNTLDIINYLDGNPHIWLVVYNGTNISLYIDNVKKTSFTFTFESSEATNPLGIGSTPTSTNQNYGVWGKIYRIKYFNFDMSADDAPYTIADYISGKDESPLLQLGVQSYNTSDMIFSSANSTNYPCGVVSDSATDTITITTTGETASEYTWIDGRANAIAIPQGANVEVSVGDLDVATSVQCYFYSVSGKAHDISGVSRDNPKSFVASEDLMKLSLIVHTGLKPIPTGTIMVITGLKVKVNGALLSLEDVKSGVQILDKSGNANNANISGTVYASKENNPARCVDSASFSWAGTATTQKFANSDVAIPANSKVVAYAKASVGMSASFTCGSNSAVSKELSANTLTEIGSFFNASQGAFKVAPSSATTGKMEVYLTIEKF